MTGVGSGHDEAMFLTWPIDRARDQACLIIWDAPIIVQGTHVKGTHVSP